MSYRGNRRSPYNTPTGFNNGNRQTKHVVSPNTSFNTGWGAPARSYSPNYNGNQFERSPMHFNQLSPMSSSPRNVSCYTPNMYNQHRFSMTRSSTPHDSRFKSPFSPNGTGRKALKKQFQSPRHEINPNNNPGGSSNIEDYYHSSMLEDPWKFCKPVPTKKLQT